jgi:hypothetical protein
MHTPRQSFMENGKKTLPTKLSKAFKGFQVTSL